jgi:hypothetical protein
VKSDRRDWCVMDSSPTGMAPFPFTLPSTLAEPRTTWNLAMIWRRDAYLSHAAKAWFEILCESHAKGTLGERPKPPIRR